MLEKMARPSSTAATMVAKLSSASTMSAAENLHFNCEDKCNYSCSWIIFRMSQFRLAYLIEYNKKLTVK